MTETKKEKQTIIYRWLMAAFHVVGLGMLTYIGTNLIPYISKSLKHYEDNDTRLTRMEAKYDIHLQADSSQKEVTNFHSGQIEYLQKQINKCCN